jgi:tellurite resistance protein TerC
MTRDEITYLTFGIVMVASIVIDLGLMNKKDKVISIKNAFYQSMFWIGLSFAFFGFLWFEMGNLVATKFITAYLMEKSLSIDNIFVFILIFSYFKVKENDASRALFVGIVLAIVFRVIFIALGIELINRFHWLLYVFGAFLLYTGVKLFFSNEEEEFNPGESIIYKWTTKLFRITHVEPKGRYIINQGGKTYFTTLALVVLILAATDIVFALDSIPTVVSLVRDSPRTPFSDSDIMVIYTSNIFAVLGLRSLFFLLRGAVDKFDFLQQGIAVVLAFIGVKMLIEFFGIHISIQMSLLVILVSLGSAILYSQYHNRKNAIVDKNENI